MFDILSEDIDIRLLYAIEDNDLVFQKECKEYDFADKLSLVQAAAARLLHSELKETNWWKGVLYLLTCSKEVFIKPIMSSLFKKKSLHWKDCPEDLLKTIMEALYLDLKFLYAANCFCDRIQYTMTEKMKNVVIGKMLPLTTVQDFKNYFIVSRRTDEEKIKELLSSKEKEATFLLADEIYCSYTSNKHAKGKKTVMNNVIRKLVKGTEVQEYVGWMLHHIINGVNVEIPQTEIGEFKKDRINFLKRKFCKDTTDTKGDVIKHDHTPSRTPIAPFAQYVEYLPLDNLKNINELVNTLIQNSPENINEVKKWASDNINKPYLVSYFLARLARHQKGVLQENEGTNISNTEIENLEVPNFGKDVMRCLQIGDVKGLKKILNNIGQARTKLYYYVCKHSFQKSLAYDAFVLIYLKEYVSKLGHRRSLRTMKENVIVDFYLNYCCPSKNENKEVTSALISSSSATIANRAKAKRIFDSLKEGDHARAIRLMDEVASTEKYNVLSGVCSFQPLATKSFQIFVERKVRPAVKIIRKRKEKQRTQIENQIVDYFTNFNKLFSSLSTAPTTPPVENISTNESPWLQYSRKLASYVERSFAMDCGTIFPGLTYAETMRCCLEVYVTRFGKIKAESFCKLAITPHILRSVEQKPTEWKNDADKKALIEAVQKFYNIEDLLRKYEVANQPIDIPQKQSAFTIMQKHEFNLDWRWCQFRAGGFTVICPNDNPIKFSPIDKRVQGTLYSFNYIKDYLNERLPNIKCSVEKGVLTILSPISYDTAILRVAYEKGKQHRMEMEIEEKENKPRKITPMRTTFQTSYNRPMTDRELRAYKSPYIDHLISLQEKEYRVIPCVEAMTHRDSESLETAFLFTIRFGRGLFIVFENVYFARSTYLFKIANHSVYMDAARAVHEFMQSHELNKRSYLRSSFASMRNRGIIGFDCIDHSETYNWKRLLAKKAREMYP